MFFLQDLRRQQSGLFNRLQALPILLEHRAALATRAVGLRLLVLLLSACLVTGCAAPQAQSASAAQLYAQAKASLNKKSWRTAIEQLRALEAEYPYGVYAEQVQIDIAYAYYRNSEPDAAVAATERFIKLHPTHAAVDYAYYLTGLASFEEDDSLFGRLTGRDDLSDRDSTRTRRALQAFKTVYTRFPKSRYAADAKTRAVYLLNSLAQHEISIAIYYYSRQAYVAVVNRAKGVIENYPESPQVEVALGLLVHSYAEMGLNQLTTDSRRVLALNFPNSKYLGASSRDMFVGKWYSVRNAKAVQRAKKKAAKIAKKHVEPVVVSESIGQSIE